MKKKPPKWLTFGTDSVTVKFDNPVTLNGIKRDTITLRAPLVRDIRAAHKLAPNDEDERELWIYASLAEVSIADLEGLRWKDFQRIQEGYFRLISDDDLEPGTPVATVPPAGGGTALPPVGDRGPDAA